LQISIFVSKTLNMKEGQNTGTMEVSGMPDGVTITTLENGLAIIVREDQSAPVVSAQAWCRTGSIHEGKWLGAGLSHVLEHMLFKGTTTRAGARIDQEVQEAGGYMNAYTSFDRTVYHIDVPDTGARVAIDILCDIMQNATLPEDELEKEKQVIVREMDMNVDDPNRRSSRRLFETAYTRSPYRFTIIGYPDIFHELKPSDIREYYRERYAANNVFFVVAGAVKTEDVVAQIKGCYASTKARPMPPMVLPEEPRQAAPREVVEEAPIELAYLHMAWHIPELRHPDTPVLDVIAALLGSGRSSRLFQEVREKKGLMHYIDAWVYSPGLAGLLGISGTCEAEDFPAARDAALEELEKLKTEEVSAEELSKAVKQFLAGFLSTRKTMQGQAQDLGSSWIAAHDLNFSERYLDKVKRITPADIQRVANQYLTAENCTVYALLPEGKSQQTARHVEALADRPVQLFRFPNGLRLLVKENHRLPFVDFRVVFRGGVQAETLENNGITQLTGKLLLKGTTSRSAEAISREIESVGGSLDSYGANQSFGLNCEVMNPDFELGLNLIRDVLLNSTFPEAALNREREIQLAALRSMRDQLLQSASRGMRRALFGTTGYGLDAVGNEESLTRLTTSDLKAFYSRLAVPSNCVIAIYGDVDVEATRTAVEAAFGQWSGTLQCPEPPAPAPLAKALKVTETRDKKQCVMVMGFPGTTLHHPDRYALDLVQEACSDLGSRLFLRVREKLGLAYFVGAQNFPGLVPGFFSFYVGTAPEKADQVGQELLKEAELLSLEGLTAEELSRAKAKVLGQRKIARQDLGQLATTAALDELYGKGFAHSDIEDALYEAVTLEEVRATAGKYLSPERYVLSVISPTA
jgi:zinc protease